MSLTSTSWFKVEEAGAGVFRIIDGNVSNYLIEGMRSALLIDASWGIGDLPALVATLTKKPVTLINTHGHVDHVCGNYQFDDVMIDQKDITLMETSYAPGARANIIKRFLSNPLPDGFDTEAWIAASLPHVTPISGTPSFDLGGRTVSVIEMPGHTQGCICLLDSKDKLLFTGDSVSEGNMLLHMTTSTKLSTYHKSLGNLVAMSSRFEKLLPSHNRSPIEHKVLEDLHNGVGQVLSGEKKGEPTETPWGVGLLARFQYAGVFYKGDNL
jgi:hydroxyacylglutathione hydrolase